MKKYAKSIWVWIILGIFLPVCHAQECLTKFPEECNPERIGLKLAERFLASGHMSPIYSQRRIMLSLICSVVSLLNCII